MAASKALCLWAGSESDWQWSSPYCWFVLFCLFHLLLLSASSFSTFFFFFFVSCFLYFSPFFLPSFCFLFCFCSFCPVRRRHFQHLSTTPHRQWMWQKCCRCLALSVSDIGKLNGSFASQLNPEFWMNGTQACFSWYFLALAADSLFNRP